MSDSQPIESTRPKRVIRRRRKCLACDSCYKKKIHCDRATPKCNWCYHHNIACTFTRNEKRFQDQQPHDTNPQSMDVPSRTSLSGNLRPDSCSSRSLNGQRQGFSWQLESISPASSPGPTAKPHNARLTLGNICAFNGLPFFSASGREWIERQTGEEARLGQFSPDRNCTSFTSAPATTATSTSLPSTPLPDKTLVYQVLGGYTSSVFSHMFPFITRSLFEDTIRAAYHQDLSPTSPRAISAKACVMAFVALGPMYCNSLSQSQLQYLDECAAEAYRLIPELLGHMVDLDGLQTVLILCIHSQTIVGDLFTLEFLIAAATRFVYHLEGNIFPAHGDGQPLQVKRHIRTLFWLCYIVDHEQCLRSGLPPNIDDTHCDLTLPECYGDSTALSTCSPLLLPFVRLSLVQSEIYRRLYAVAALRQTDAELLRTIRDLDELLENWKLSIPIDNRPTFTDRPSDAGSIPSSVMQLQYHYLMATIHQASGRCISWSQNQNTHGPGSSLAISVEASRSLLRKFSESELDFHRHNLLFCLPYFTAVMIHLFCNFLLHPLDPRCQADLDVMDRVPQRIMAHMWPQAPVTFRMQVDFVKELSTELQRLAHSALRKALSTQA